MWKHKAERTAFTHWDAAAVARVVVRVEHQHAVAAAQRALDVRQLRALVQARVDQQTDKHYIGKAFTLENCSTAEHVNQRVLLRAGSTRSCTAHLRAQMPARTAPEP